MFPIIINCLLFTYIIRCRWWKLKLRFEMCFASQPKTHVLFLALNKTQSEAVRGHYRTNFHPINNRRRSYFDFLFSLSWHSIQEVSFWEVLIVIYFPLWGGKWKSCGTRHSIRKPAGWIDAPMARGHVEAQCLKLHSQVARQQQTAAVNTADSLRPERRNIVKSTVDTCSQNALLIFTCAVTKQSHSPCAFFDLVNS